MLGCQVARLRVLGIGCNMFLLGVVPPNSKLLLLGSFEFNLWEEKKSWKIETEREKSRMKRYLSWFNTNY